MLKKIIIPALLIAFVCALQLPIEIYLNNENEFILPLKSMIYTWSGAFIVIFLLFFLPSLAFKKNRDGYFALLSMLALLVWFNAHFMFGHYGVMDGRGLSIAPVSVRAILEIFVWVSLLMLAVVFRKKINPYLLQANVLLVALVVLFTAYQVFSLGYKNTIIKEAKASVEMPENFLTFSVAQNIIHIVLDEHQSTVMEHMIETDLAFKQKLTGFIFFPNTSANYRSTNMAIPAMLTGQVYKNDSDKNTFLTEVLENNPMTQALENKGYDTQIYSMGFYCNKTKLKNCIPQPSLSPDVSAFLLLDYSVFKAAPDILKPAIYNEEDWFISRHFVNPNYETTLGGLNHLAFAYFNEHMKTADIPPTYKFYHSMITHSPSVLGKDCELRIKRISRHDIEGKADQAVCAFNHIFTFLDKLKTAGIYDQTLIIISSDHGANYLSKEQQENLANNTVPPRHYSTALATLLIKPFDAHGELRISNAPIALNDISNTILAQLHLPLLAHGENALAIKENDTRTREFIFYEFDNTYWEEAKLPPLTIYTISGDVRDVRNWKLQCSEKENECEK